MTTQDAETSRLERAAAMAGTVPPPVFNPLAGFFSWDPKFQKDGEPFRPLVDNGLTADYIALSISSSDDLLGTFGVIPPEIPRQLTLISNKVISTLKLIEHADPVQIDLLRDTTCDDNYLQYFLERCEDIIHSSCYYHIDDQEMYSWNAVTGTYEGTIFETNIHEAIVDKYIDLHRESWDIFPNSPPGTPMRDRIPVVARLFPGTTNRVLILDAEITYRWYIESNLSDFIREFNGLAPEERDGFLTTTNPYTTAVRVSLCILNSNVDGLVRIIQKNDRPFQECINYNVLFPNWMGQDQAQRDPLEGRNIITIATMTAMSRLKVSELYDTEPIQVATILREKLPGYPEVDKSGPSKVASKKYKRDSITILCRLIEVFKDHPFLRQDHEQSPLYIAIRYNFVDLAQEIIGAGEIKDDRLRAAQGYCERVAASPGMHLPAADLLAVPTDGYTAMKKMLVAPGVTLNADVDQQTEIYTTNTTPPRGIQTATRRGGGGGGGAPRVLDLG